MIIQLWGCLFPTLIMGRVSSGIRTIINGVCPELLNATPCLSPFAPKTRD